MLSLLKVWVSLLVHWKYRLNCTYLHTCCRYNCILTGCMSSCTSLGCWCSRYWRGSHVNHWYIHSRLGIRKKCLCSIQGDDIFKFMIKKESSFVWHQVMFKYLVQFQQLKAPDGPSILEFWRFMKFKYEKQSICKYYLLNLLNEMLPYSIIVRFLPKNNAIASFTAVQI